MRHRSLLVPASLILLGVAGACDRTPDYVLKKQMVDLLTDIHKAEGVVDLNRTRYGSDSMRKVMKQSVLLRHGVTQEQFDTSMVWYGHNIERYIEVYDDVIARLESEVAEVDADQGGARVDMAVVGDSADAWPESRMHRYFYGQPDAMVRFNLRRDENWETGDIYTWRFYKSNMQSPLYYAIAAQYTDGTSDYMTGTTTGQGWSEIVMQIDTARTAQNVYGFATVSPAPGEVAYIDSIALVRTRFSPDHYDRASVRTYTPAANNPYVKVTVSGSRCASPRTLISQFYSIG